MNAVVWVIVMAVVVIAIILLLALRVVMSRRRSDQLREKFGLEYDLVVEQVGGRRPAESQLKEREKRVEDLDIHPLPDDDRQRFAQSWQTVQSEFLDDPAVAVTHAERLIADVMEASGYPAGNFERRVADISVNHSGAVENYRAAHEIAVRHVQGDADTEDLRQAMVHYRALFGDLLKVPDGETVEAPRGLLKQRSSTP
jgi:hypothetical protein